MLRTTYFRVISVIVEFESIRVLFKFSTSEMIKTLLENLSNDTQTLKQKEQELEDLSDAVESIDHAKRVGTLRGWKVLIELFNKGLSERANCLILKTVRNAIQNSAACQKDVIDSGFVEIFKNLLGQPQYQKEMLGILSAFYQNPEYAAWLNE